MPENSNKLARFWQELRRRKVTRVITVYAAAAFVILELTDIVAPSLGLPDWTLNFIIILLVVGFIIALILSWIYDIHPEDGIVKTGPVRHAKEETHVNSKGWKIATFVSAAIIITLLSINLFGNRGKVRRDASLEKSIAVLPMLNLSGDPGKEHISDGLTNDIITQLSRIQSFDKVV
ncbi:MAG: hypothetical protein KAR16_08625 [Bacteroidales bacterium]|nr:hypothetical protein [Bacteroidales bacterium]